MRKTHHFVPPIIFSESGKFFLNCPCDVTDVALFAPQFLRGSGDGSTYKNDLSTAVVVSCETVSYTERDCA